MSEHGHDRLDAGAAFGELGADGVNRCAVIVGLPAESTSPAAVQAALSDSSNRNALDNSLPRTRKTCCTARPALGSNRGRA
jgi:hypothetical protein